MFITLIALILLKVRDIELNKDIKKGLLIAYALTILSSLCFTLYSDVYGIMNAMGILLISYLL
jgi:hypothetical protein